MSFLIQKFLVCAPHGVSNFGFYSVYPQYWLGQFCSSLKLTFRITTPFNSNTDSMFKPNLLFVRKMCLLRKICLTSFSRVNETSWAPGAKGGFGFWTGHNLLHRSQSVTNVIFCFLCVMINDLVLGDFSSDALEKMLNWLSALFVFQIDFGSLTSL